MCVCVCVYLRSIPRPIHIRPRARGSETDLTASWVLMVVSNVEFIIDYENQFLKRGPNSNFF